MEGVFSTNDNPRCRTAGVLNYTKGTGTCRREDIDAFRGLTAANTDPPLVFAGKSTLNDFFL